jgi:hypothetical protein
MRTTMYATLFAAGAAMLAPLPALAWDYPGHRIVGAIADAVLNKHYSKTQKAVAKLLATTDAAGNVIHRTLSQVAVFPDCAKPNGDQWCGRPPSSEEKAYVMRNPHHSSYHFTDVPIQQTKYVAFSPGTEETDVVQMINYVIAQFRGKKPWIKDVNLTTTEALWLLTHLVGDIHQPLHVGAIYYDKETCTRPLDPNLVPGGMPNVVATFGGNDIGLDAHEPKPALAPADNLHLFWDGTTIARAMKAAGLAGDEESFARSLAAKPPVGWQPTGDPEKWAEQWAAEALPLAAKAHSEAPPDGIKIELDKREPQANGKIKCTWKAKIEQPYSDWAQKVATEQVAKAGFRLAALLVAIIPTD